MHEVAEQLAKSLLFEGYALYPYTPAATKNATPTPFGIAYPTAYANAQPAAFDHVRIELVALPEEGAEIEGAALFLLPEGERHKAAERRLEVGPVPVAKLLEGPIDAAGGSAAASMSTERATGGAVRVRLEVRNTKQIDDAEAASMDRGEALHHSLLSCHAMLGISAGRFASPLEDEGEIGAAVQACENVNAWPVLASPEDDAALGAAVFLPDHPAISPQSRVNFFDNTEIEEALVLHVQALTDEERAAIDTQDPAVREMIERAEATTQEDLLSMHGVMAPTKVSDSIAFPEWTEPSEDGGGEPEPPVRPPPPGPADTAGEDVLVVDGKRFERGGKVVLVPGVDGDPYDKMMHGRTATLERIYLDYDGKAYFGVSIDDDPMSEVLRDTGRYLFFFAEEVDPLR